jgi:hypothetical protein
MIFFQYNEMLLIRITELKLLSYFLTSVADSPVSPVRGREIARALPTQRSKVNATIQNRAAMKRLACAFDGSKTPFDIRLLASTAELLASL